MLSTLDRPASLSSRVTDRLRDAIVSGSVAPGDAISEVAFAEKLGVSRVPVREALVELERNGLVEFDQRGRTHVPVLTAKDFSEIYEMRLALEPLAARLLTERADAETFAALELNITATTWVKSLGELSGLDAEFHDLIVRGSGSRRLWQGWDALRYQVKLWLTHMHRKHQGLKRGTVTETLASHRKLLALLRGGRPEPAVEEMRHHIKSWGKMLSLAGNGMAD